MHANLLLTADDFGRFFIDKLLTSKSQWFLNMVRVASECSHVQPDSD